MALESSLLPSQRALLLAAFVASQFMVLVTYLVLNIRNATVRNLVLKTMSVAWLMGTPLFGHPDVRARLVCNCLGWIFALRTWELSHNPVLVESIRRSRRLCLAFILGTVDRRNPRIKPSERWARVAKRAGRGMLKVLAFHPLMCAVPSFSGDLAREAWASHPYFSLSRFVMTLGGGAIIYLWMGGVADLGYALLETVVNVRVRDMFAAPWEATSIRSFWKWRWNATFQEGLECAIVPGEPVRTEEVDHKKHDGEPKHHDKQKKMSFMQTMFSAFLIFLLSGFFHDAVNYATWGYLSPTTTIFFFLQFLAVAIEFPVSKMMIYRLTPKYIKIVAVLLWLAVSGGLFVAPYMQHGGLAVFASPLGECGNIYEKASNAFGKHTAVAV